MHMDVPRIHPSGPDSSSPSCCTYNVCRKWKVNTILLNAVLSLRAKHQPQAGRAHWEARPTEQAALHGRLLQSHRGSSPQHPLHRREAEEPESIQNTKEPGSFPGVKHCRYREVCWACFAGCGIVLCWTGHYMGTVPPILGVGCYLFGFLLVFGCWSETTWFQGLGVIQTKQNKQKQHYFSLKQCRTEGYPNPTWKRKAIYTEAVTRSKFLFGDVR